jgi:hypothetical protein
MIINFNFDNDLKKKYFELNKIFKPKTIEYLKSNGYKFENNLHQFTLQSLYEEEYEVFENILFNGLYDDDYSFNIEKKYTDKHGYNITSNYDLLNLMAEKGYYNKKYYISIGNSNKKNLGLYLKNGCTWLYNSIQLYGHKYSEDTIIEIIKNYEELQINKNQKKVNKFIKKIFVLGYDDLLSCLLEKNIFDKEKIWLIELLEKKNFIFNKFIKSSHLLYEFVKKNTQGKIKVNHYNYKFYLEASRKLIISNNKIYDQEWKQDYKDIICSDFIYKYTIDILGSIAVYYYMDNDTMLANEILQNIDIYKSIKYFADFESDVIQYNLVKLYENISKGLYSEDYIPLIKNIILIKHNIDVKYKDVDDFEFKIKPIIPKLLKVPTLNNIDVLLEIFNKAVQDCNQELCMCLLKKFNFNKFFKYIKLDKSEQIDLYDLSSINKNIILNLLSNNMDDVIFNMLETFKIELFDNYYYGESFYSSILINTFLELLLKNNKISLIKKIIENGKINVIYRKNLIMSNILFLALYYNVDELTYHIFENYLQYVNPQIFIILLEDKLKIESIQFNKIIENINNHQPKINNNPYISTSGLDLLFKTNSDWLIDKCIEQFLTRLPHYLIDKDYNSLITLMIKNNKTTRLEQVINWIGKSIFNHIPMFMLNYHNISHKNQLSNGLELYWACKKNLNNIACFFVSNKLGNINYIDVDGNTCLIIACENKMESIVHELINYSHPKFIVHTNNLGLQAIDYAKKNNLTEICDLINKKKNIYSSQSNKSINQTNPFTTNPFTNSNLKQSELIFLTNWINLQNKEN